MSLCLPILALLSHAAQAQEPPPGETGSTDPVPVEQELNPEEDSTEEVEGEPIEGETPEETPDPISEMPPLPYEEVDTEVLALEQAQADAQLLRYCAKTQSVFIAQVLSVFEVNNEQRVSLLIEERIHGRARGVIDIRIPAPIATDDPTRIYPRVVEGYKMVVFLSRQGTLIEGNSLFLYQGGFAWRNKRPDAFLQPSSNQDWVEQVDPSQDYIVFSMDQIRACLE
jgi:hypothetical protein